MCDRFCTFHFYEGAKRSSALSGVWRCQYVPFIERKREEKETEPLKEAEECARIQTPTGGIEGYLAATALTQTPAEIANRVDVTTAPSTLAQNRTEFYNSLVGAEALQEPQNPGLYTLEALS
jgi:hypothetical protein